MRWHENWDWHDGVTVLQVVHNIKLSMEDDEDLAVMTVLCCSLFYISLSMDLRRRDNKCVCSPQAPDCARLLHNRELCVQLQGQHGFSVTV